MDQKASLAEYIKMCDCCPQCHSDTGMKYPRTGSPYCEDCGYPDEHRDQRPGDIVSVCSKCRNGQGRARGVSLL